MRASRGGVAQYFRPYDLWYVELKRYLREANESALIRKHGH